MDVNLNGTIRLCTALRDLDAVATLHQRRGDRALAIAELQDPVPGRQLGQDGGQVLGVDDVLDEVLAGGVFQVDRLSELLEGVIGRHVQVPRHDFAQ